MKKLKIFCILYRPTDPYFKVEMTITEQLIVCHLMILATQNVICNYVCK